MTQEQLRGFPYEVIPFDISQSTSGDNEIKAIKANKHLVVVGFVLISHGAVEAKFVSGSSGTGENDITGPLTSAGVGGSGYAQDRDTEYGCFWTRKSEALVLNTSTAVRVSGYVLVVEADDMPPMAPVAM